MPPPVGKEAISVAFVRSSDCLSVAYIPNNSRTQRPSVPKFGKKVPHFRCDSQTSFKVKRSKVRVTGQLTQTHEMCHIFRTVKRKNFKVDVRMEDVDPHQRQAPWSRRLKVKVTRSHGMSDPCGPYCEICTWYSDKVPRRVWRTIAMTSKVKDQDDKLTSSHICLFLIRLTKCCTCVIRGGRRHTMSAEPGGHTSCF